MFQLGTTTNPTTGEQVTAIYATISGHSQPVKCLNSLEELKAYGKMADAHKALIVRDGQYGKPFCHLPQVTFTAVKAW